VSARQDYLAVAGRVRSGLSDLELVVTRVERIWHAEHPGTDDWYVDATALNLLGFYAGVERLLAIIAEAVDGAKPAGAEWHQALLSQMASEIPGVRPAVVSPELKVGLDRFRGFRHVVRNVYTYNLDAEQVERLVQWLPETAAQVGIELRAFADTLEKLASD
jgi:hypothetical protein